MIFKSLFRLRFKTDFQPQVWNDGQRGRGLKMFTREGAATAAAYSMTSVFLPAFALALGADSLYIGLLSAIPMALWTLALLPSALFCQKHIEKRKSIVVAASLIAWLFWVPIILIGVLLGPVAITLSLLLILVTMSTFVGAFSTPAWASVAGDLVPEQMRGRYFSKRTVAATAAGLSASLAAGWILDVFGRNDVFGFAVIFSIGLGFALLSSLLFAKIPSPPAELTRKFHRSAIREVLQDRRFRTFLLIFAVWQFGIMLVAPFTTIFILKTLQAEYIWISIFLVVSGIASILVQRGWGIFSDRYGHRVMMIIATFGTAPVILLWIFAVNPWMLVPVEVLSGIMWAGIGLAQYNYMLETSPARSRAVYAAMFSVIIGIMGVLGPIAGGLTAEYFSTTALFGLTEFRVLFLMSGIFRFMAGLLLWRFLGEVVEKRERVHPGYVFGEMLKYGVQGGILKLHHAAGSFAKDISAVEKDMLGAARTVEKDVAIAAHAFEGAVEEITNRADRSSEKISAVGTAWPSADKRKHSEKKRMRVKVSD